MTVVGGKNLTGSKVLLANIGWNLGGNVAPFLIAFFAIPALIARLGVSRFGVLTIIWMVIGYLGLFDFGLGRAVTKLVAERLGTKRADEIPDLFFTSIVVTVALGILGTICVLCSASYCVNHVLNIPEKIRPDALKAFVVMGCTLPAVIVSVALTGVFGAMQRFKFLSLVRTGIGCINFLGPLAAIYWSKTLFATTLALAAGRYLALVAYAMYARPISELWNGSPKITSTHLRELFSFGGWITVSNIISPLMDNFDRFFMGTILTMSAVAYYTTPFDLVRRISIVPGSIITVLFPAFSHLVNNDQEKGGVLFRDAISIVCPIMSIAVLAVVLFSPEFLRFWLGNEFALRSSSVMRVLAIGLFLNSLAFFPYALLQGAGRPDWTAKLHLVELPIYYLLLWYLLKNFGIVGAAVAWLARIALDTFFLYALTGKIVASLQRVSLGILAALFAEASLFVTLMWVQNVFLKIAIFFTALFVCMILLLPKVKIVLRGRGAQAAGY